MFVEYFRCVRCWVLYNKVTLMEPPWEVGTIVFPFWTGAQRPPNLSKVIYLAKRGASFKSRLQSQLRMDTEQSPYPVCLLHGDRPLLETLSSHGFHILCSPGLPPTFLTTPHSSFQIFLPYILVSIRLCVQHFFLTQQCPIHLLAFNAGSCISVFHPCPNPSTYWISQVHIPNAFQTWYI